MKNERKYADGIHSALLSAILEGRYHPGDVLNEIPISKEYGVSRTPVREALQRLGADGLVDRGPRRAVIVRKIPVHTLHALFEAMGEIEALVTHFAALRMSEIERRALMTIIEAGDDTSADFEEVNRRFHKALRDGAHNPILAEVIEDLELRSMPWRQAQFCLRTDRIATSQVEHRAIAAAILDKNASEAQNLMRVHTAETFNVVLEIFAREDGGLHSATR